MQRIDDRTVELTDEEMEASEAFDELLDRGLGIVDAANRVAKDYPDLDPEFWAWLQQP